MPLQWRSKSPVHNPGNLMPSTSAGPGGSSATYDGANGNVVLYNTAGETWTWDGSDWTHLSPTHHPSARFSACMAYLPGTGVILFGGRDIATTPDYGETWKWDGSDWTQLSPTHSPSARPFAGMSYWPNGGKLILYGGSPSSGTDVDTWTYNGSDWTDVTPSPSKPNDHMTNPVVVRDANGDVRCIGAVSGTSTRVWIWNGTTWVDNGTMGPDDPTSVTNASQAGVYSPALGRGVFIMRPEAQPGTTETWFETATSYATDSSIAHPGAAQTNVNQVVAQNPNGNAIYIYQNRVTTVLKGTFELTASSGFSAQII